MRIFERWEPFKNNLKKIKKVVDKAKHLCYSIRVVAETQRQQQTGNIRRIFQMDSAKRNAIVP